MTVDLDYILASCRGTYIKNILTKQSNIAKV